MSRESSIETAAFQSHDLETEIFSSQSVSKLAIFAFIFAIIGLLAPLSVRFILASFVAAVSGAIAVWWISRSENLSGMRLAQLALCLGAATAAWTITSSSRRNTYLFKEAGMHAELFLNLLAEGKKYEAVELLYEEPQRQITGTDLEKYYLSLPESEGTLLRELLSNPEAKRVFQAGAEASWKLKHGIDVVGNPRAYKVRVLMGDENSDSRKPIKLELTRKTGILVEDKGAPTAHWNVTEVIVEQ